MAAACHVYTLQEQRFARAFSLAAIVVEPANGRPANAASVRERRHSKSLPHVRGDRKLLKLPWRRCH